MYIFKNAFRNIVRSLGRNVLIGIIVVVIATSACIALSIGKSANIARESGMDLLNITASINASRDYAVEQARAEIQEENPDLSDTDPTYHTLLKKKMNSMDDYVEPMTLDELQEYAKQESVNDFYYSMAIGLNGAEDGIIPYGSYSSSDSEAESNEASEMGGPGGPGAPVGESDPISVISNMCDFTVLGYSKKDAMEDFVDGISKIVEGSVFEEGTSNNDCVINEDLATYNSISVGDQITLVNPSNEEQTIELTVVGIYETETSDISSSISGSSTANDPTNQILMSYTALNAIVEESKTTADLTEEADSDEDSTELKSILVGTFVLPDMANYDLFEAYLYECVGEKYTLSSSDIAAFEAGLLPLENLKNFATTFLWIIMIIGAVILIVINMFNIQERKYEIGVMTAIGMKKVKVALQFILEIFIVTIVSILIGTVIGSVTSVPITNSLLESQINEQKELREEEAKNFGENPQEPQEMQEIVRGGVVKESDVIVVDSVSFSVDFTLIMQMILIGIVLTVISSSISILFIMRYEPLKILTNRD